MGYKVARTFGKSKQKSNPRLQSHFFSKKFRFWRLFKSYFLYKKKCKNFLKLGWLFNNRRILKHQFMSIYYLPLKRRCFLHQNYYGYGDSLFNFMLKNELKLSIVLVRSRLTLNILNCFISIKKKIVSVNSAIIVTPNFCVCKLDIVQKRRKLKLFKKYTRYCLHHWRRHRWKTARFRLRCKRYNPYIGVYLFSRNSLYINYIQPNYKILSAIIISNPTLSDILLTDAYAMLIKRVYRQLYFLY